MSQTFNIGPEDDIHEIVNKLSDYSGESVNIIVPRGAKIFQNIVDAYLLRDAIAENDQEVRIITNDIMGRVFAERAGISVASGPNQSEEVIGQMAMAKVGDIVPKSKKGAPRKSTKKKVTKVASKKTAEKKEGKRNSSDAASRFFQSYKEAGIGSFSNIPSRSTKNPKKYKGRVSVPKIGITILVVALAVLFFVFGKILPKAEAIIYPVREPASFSIEVLVDRTATEADPGRGVLPGEILISTQSESGEFTASGLENVSSKARGTITIFNDFSSSPQTFIPSRFESDGGKIFWTTETITVPGTTVQDGQNVPGQIRAEVVAAEPGEEFNIGPSTFQMPALAGTPRFEKVYARSDSSMEGGKIGEAGVVSQQDHDNALSSLRSGVSSSLNNFRQNLPSGFILWDEAYNEETVDESTTKNIGEPANNFSANLEVVARAVVFKDSDLNKLLDAEINSRLTAEQTILPSSKKIEFLKPPIVDYQEGTILATLQVKADIIENLSTDSFRKAILKKNKEEIKQILPSFGGIERVEVKLWPFWVKNVPSNPERVEVSIFDQ